MKAPDLIGRGDVGALLAGGWRGAARAGRPGDEAIVDGVGVELRQPGMQGIDVTLREPLREKLSSPRADL
jgi:hypothetical protein